MMAIDQFAMQVYELILPALPYIFKGVKIGGKMAAEKLGELGAGKSMELAEKVWKKITHNKARSRKLNIAAQELLITPKDKTWQDMVEREIREILEEDPKLMREISILMQVDTPEQTIHAIGNVRTKIEQSVIGDGKQKIVAEKNKNLEIHQNIKKK